MAFKKLDPDALVAINKRAYNNAGFLPIFEHGLAVLWNNYERIRKSKQNLWVLLPVPFVTHLEVFFRSAVQSMVDHGDPFLNRAEALTRNVGFNFSLVKALHGKSITLGTLVAHALPFSDYSHIDNPMTCLLGQPYGQLLSQTHDRWSVEVLGKDRNPIIGDLDGTIRSIQRLFHVRHVVVHEVPSEPPFDEEELQTFYSAVIRLMEATSEILNQLMYPNAPLTQQDLNIRAAKDLEDEQSRFNEVIEKLRNQSSPERAQRLSEAIESWKLFSDVFAEFVADEYRGGTIWPLIHATEKAELHEGLRHHIEAMLASTNNT